MRLPEPTHRAAALILIAAALLFAVLGAWTLVARSAIPLEVDGTITSIDIREEKHPGVDDAWFVGVDGDEQHLDASLARSLNTGDTLHKTRWATTMTVNGQQRSLRPSGDAKAMLLLAPTAVLACATLALPPRRARRSRHAGTQAKRADQTARR